MKNPAGSTMKCFLAVACLWVTTLATSPCTAATPEEAPAPRVTTTARAPIEIVDARFGTFTGEAQRFTATRIVRGEPHLHFGWSLRLRTQRAEVRWREETRLPHAISFETHEGSGITYSADGRTVTKRGLSEPGKARRIGNTWPLHDDLPRGHYTTRIYVEGRLAAVFRYEVR